MTKKEMIDKVLMFLQSKTDDLYNDDPESIDCPIDYEEINDGLAILTVLNDSETPYTLQSIRENTTSGRLYDYLNDYLYLK